MTRQLLDENPDPGDDDIRHYLSGNLCRCAAYPQIIEAVQAAARKRQAATHSVTPGPERSEGARGP
jgi:carbon-monoxide dehydrogenase small subunit